MLQPSRLLFTSKLLLPRRAFTRTMSSTTNGGNSPSILGELHNRVGVLTLNRPKVLNSLDEVMVSQLKGIISKWKSGNALDSLIIDSSCPKAFCAGGDIVAVTTKSKVLSNPAFFFKEEYELDHSLATLDMPVTSLIHGIVMGGGVGLSVHGRYRVGTETTLFAMPEVSIGLFPDVGGSWFLPRLQGKLGWYLGMTGHRLKGSDAFHAGILTHMCPSESLLELKRDLLAASPNDVESVLSSYHDKFPLSPFSISDQALQLIDNVFGKAKSPVHLLQLLQEKSEDPFASKALSAMRRGSPTSIAITFELLKRGTTAGSLGECLSMEYNMTKEIMKRNDFYEGVRALLIDKDLSPKWNPDSIDDIKDIQDFFKNDSKLNL